MLRLLRWVPLAAALSVVPADAAPVTAAFFAPGGFAEEYVEWPYSFGFYIPDDRVGVNQSNQPGGGLFVFPNATVWWEDAISGQSSFNGMTIQLTDQDWGVELYVYEVGAILVDHSRQWLDPAPERIDFRSPFWTNFRYEAFPEFDSSKTQIQVAEPSTLLLLGLGGCAVSLGRHGTMRRRQCGSR